MSEFCEHGEQCFDDVNSDSSHYVCGKTGQRCYWLNEVFPQPKLCATMCFEIDAGKARMEKAGEILAEISANLRTALVALADLREVAEGLASTVTTARVQCSWLLTEYQEIGKPQDVIEGATHVRKLCEGAIAAYDAWKEANPE